jgi:hypothetical protein
MAKHSEYERKRRAEQAERVKEIEKAWLGSIPAPIAASFAATVKAAKERGPAPRNPDMAPGTLPRPPRPGHEPKPPKIDTDTRRRR